MEGVGESVRFVADALQHEQRLAATGHLDGLAAARGVHLLEALGQRGDRDLVEEPERAHDPLGDGKLPLAAVDEQQLRRIRELPGTLTQLVQRAIALVEIGGQPAGQHLLHRRVVVVAGHVFDLEAPVLALVGQPILEHHHRADVVTALQVSHVVALDAQRRLGQRQQVLQLGERPAPRIVVTGAAQPMAHELFLGIACNRLVQITFVATHRHADLHS